MAKFELAYFTSIGYEGNYSNSPHDLGGETWKGISRVNFPNWKGWAIIDAIKTRVKSTHLVPELVKCPELPFLVHEFYLKTFWEPLLLNEFKQQLIADELFDTAINQGENTAVKYLQEALNLLNNNARHYSDLLVDGFIGALTFKALDAYMFSSVMPGRSVLKNTRTLLKVMNGLQFQKYVEICRKNPKQEIYMYGWINRV